ncbi:MAG: biotin--[acetyl-CoA-carboxylase] ligase [Spirochaetaceae bacterium]|jgi:BirA family biotin operon repressor/biotin-[acetyl-CoA-carboxylase] ligase|nr:biotin--[acetyl-CoA-carboxylase] ligase [Spirochaetaceae bacterium]
MVNNKNSTKVKILSMLRNSPDFVSGQKMSDHLGISRVAVWKHIKSLQELGYRINGSSTGYTLIDDKDLLYSWEFHKNRENYQTFSELISTMNTARDEVEKGCDSFTTIIAEKQSAGRGRGNHIWQSNEGGLYFTTIIKPELPLAYHYLYILAAAVAIREAVEELYRIPAKSKWPNDILFEEKKLAGVLAEFQASGDRIKWLNLGVGINVNNINNIENSCSIKEIIGSKQDRRILLTTFEDKYKKILSDSGPVEILNRWKKNNYTLNKKIQLKSITGKLFKGIAEDIDSSGSLMIKDNNKNITKALFGDLFIQ